MEPVVGWRIWRISRFQQPGIRLKKGADLSLVSWHLDYHWKPGENTALCGAARSIFPAWSELIHKPPGEHCQCGFWAAFSPLDAITRDVPAPLVWGLIQGYGEVALHGKEGFRAEKAKVLCLFTDQPWVTTVLFDRKFRRVSYLLTGLVLMAQAPTFCLALKAILFSQLITAFFLIIDVISLFFLLRLFWRFAPRRRPNLPALAESYGVPLVSLQSAIESGLLSEFGVPPEQIDLAREIVRT
jgi:hypothetical protein